VHSKKYEDLPPSQIVPRLAYEGIYIASESSYYRVLREANEIKHRGLSKPPVKFGSNTTIICHQMLLFLRERDKYK